MTSPSMVADSDIEKGGHLSHPDDVSTSGPEDAAHQTDSEQLEKLDSEPPNGGLLAWSQVLGGILLNMLAWGYPTSFGVYQLYYRDTLKLPESQISWIGSLQVFLACAMCTFSGRLADAGYIKSTIIAGSFLIVFGTFMTSLAKEYWQFFLAQGICVGLGLGIIFMPPVSVINSYFTTKRSFVLSVAATGTGFGAVVFSATVQYLIPKVGFPWAVRCAAFVALSIATLAVLILRPRLQPRKSGPLFEWEAFKEAPYAFYTLGAFLFFLALYFGFFYINAYARNVIGFSTTNSVQLILITSGMSVPSRPIVGFLADRYFGPINLYILHTLILGGLVFAWIGVHDRAGMYVFAFFFGLANGAAQGLYSAALASLTTDPRKMGTRFGMVCTIMAFATLAGPPIAGAIIDATDGRYLYAQMWAGLLLILAACVIGCSRVAVTGWKFWVKI